MSRIACLLHRPRRCTALFFWLRSASTALRARCQLFVFSCRSDLVVVNRGCGSLPHRTTDRPRLCAHTRHFLSSGVRDWGKHNTPSELGICTCGPCNRREPSASHSQWAETASEGVPSSSGLPWDPVAVSTCATLGCTHRSISREIIAAAELANHCQKGSGSFVNL